MYYDSLSCSIISTTSNFCFYTFLGNTFLSKVNVLVYQEMKLDIRKNKQIWK